MISITTHLNRLQEVDYVVQRHVISRKGPRVLVDVTTKGIGVYKETLAHFQRFLGRMERSLAK